MTNTDFETAFEQAQRAAEAAHELDLSAAVMRGKPALEETTTTTTYRLAEPVVMVTVRGSDQLHVTAIRVSRTVFADPDEDGDLVQVEVHAAEATKDGRPAKNRSRYWRYAPASVASFVTAAASVAAR